MPDLAHIEIERDIADAAAERAAQEGVSLSAFLSQFLRRAFERPAGESSILVYDHVAEPGDAVIDKEEGEASESHARRAALYGSIFRRG
jgi:hypothetical protein